MRFLPLIIALLALASGCMDPQTRAALTQIRDTATLASAKADANTKAIADAAKAKIDADALAAKNKPTAHPIIWADLLIGEIAGPTKLVAFVASGICLVGIGLWVASFFFVGVATLLAAFGKLGAILGFVVGLGCWLILFLLPLALWIIAGQFLTIGILVIYWLSKHDWSLAQAWTSLDATPSKPTTSASLAAKGITAPNTATAASPAIAGSTPQNPLSLTPIG